jgi:hypothetical protein
LHISESFQQWAIKYLHEIRQEEAQAQENSLEARQRELLRVTQSIDTLLLKYTAPENSDYSLITDTDFKTLEKALQAQGQVRTR